jgi:hypothetical protein
MPSLELVPGGSVSSAGTGRSMMIGSVSIKPALMTHYDLPTPICSQAARCAISTALSPPFLFYAVSNIYDYRDSLYGSLNLVRQVYNDLGSTILHDRIRRAAKYKDKCVTHI